MLHRIFGPVGSGKRAYLLDVIRQAFEKGERVFVLAPEQNTALYETHVEEVCGPRACMQIEVTNFSRLPNVVLREYGSLAGRSPSEAEKRLILSETVLTLRDELKNLKLKDDPDFIQSLLSDLNEMRLAGLWTASLSRLAGETFSSPALEKKLGEAALLTGAFESAVSHHYHAHGSEEERLAEILESYPFFKDCTVVVDGFWDFTYPQEILLSRILSQAKDVFVAFAADKKDPVLFEKPLKAARGLLRAANEKNIPVQDLSLTREDHGALGHLRRHLTAGDTPFTGPIQGLRLVSCQGVMGEAEFVCDTILSLVKKGAKWHEFAVLSRDGSGDRILSLTMAEKNIPCFLEEKKPLDRTPLAGTILSAVTFATGGGDPDRLRDYLKEGVFEKGSDLFCLERYISTWNLYPRALIAPSPLTANPSGYYPFTEEDRAELEAVGRAKEAYFAPIRALSVGLTASTHAEKIDAVVSYLSAIGAKEHLFSRAEKAKENGDFETATLLYSEWNAVLTALSAFGRALGAAEGDGARFLHLLTLAFSDSMPSLLLPGQDRVQIGRVGFARPEGAKYIFVTGLNAGIFPAPEKKGGLFPMREKEELREKGFAIPCGDDTLSEEYFYFYLAAAWAEKELILSYRTEETATESATLSVLGKRLFRLFPDLAAETHRPEDSLPATANDAFLRWAELVKNGSDKAEAWSDFFLGHKDFSQKALRVARAAAEENTPYRLKDHLPYEEKNVNMVYSRLEKYTLCPFSFYARYLLEAKEREKASLGAGISGSFVHSVLEKVLIALGTKGLDLAKADSRTLKEEMHLAAQCVISESIGAVQSASLAFLIERLEESCLLILENLKEEFSHSSFRPIFFEKSLGDLNGTYQIPLEDGTSLCLYGTIDRVDLYKDEKGTSWVRVVDYKTGGHDFSLTDVANGLSLQMLLYLFALWNQGFSYQGETVSPAPAGVLYLNGLQNPIACENDVEAKAALQNPYASLSREGLLVDDEHLLSAQDPEGMGRFIPVAFGKKTPSGTGNLVTLHQLGRLKEKVEKDFARLAERLKKGDVAAAPLSSKGKNLDPCRWCEYKAVCKRKERDRKPYRSHVSKEELFGEEE